MQLSIHRLSTWLLALLALATLTTAARASLRGQVAGVLWLVALALLLLLYAHGARRWKQVATAVATLLAGSTVAAAATAALRTWVPRNGVILSVPGVLVELAYSPVFFLSLAFAVSWSLLGLQVRAPGPRARSDRWSSLPLLVWSLLANRHQELYYGASGFHNFPPSVRSEVLWAAVFVLLISLLVTVAASLPTLIQDRKNRQGITIDLLALLPVVVVVVDWTMFASILTTFWLRQAG